MKIIERYVDELLDYFPVNRMTRTIRMDLLQAAAKDYRRLLDQGINKDEASNQIIEHIESPDILAKMIPNRYSVFYYILVVISLGICWAAYQYISEPDFLQIFLPARMVFPDIVERLIQYLMLLYLCYIVLCQLIRILPQKLLNRKLWQSMLFLYSGTVMTALYFSISIAFIWFSFNGYADSDMLGGSSLLRFQFIFYKHLIEPSSMVFVYAFINALCFVLSKQYYHLQFHPEPYHLDEIYHGFTLSMPEAELEAHSSEIETNEVISQLTTDLHVIIDQKTDESFSDIDENGVAEVPAEEESDQQESTALSDEEKSSESKEEDEPSQTVAEEVISEPESIQNKSAKKKKKNKSKKPVIKLANDRYKKK